MTVVAVGVGLAGWVWIGVALFALGYLLQFIGHAIEGNDAGELIAYAGRWVGADPEIPDGEGKYKLPANFHKSRVVYNLNRIPRFAAKRAEEVILVEGYFSVFWLLQNGWTNVVSPMGSTLSPEQRKLQVERFDRVRIFFDGDEAGREGAWKGALDLTPHTWVRIVDCPEGLQPDRLPLHELKRLLSPLRKSLPSKLVKVPEKLPRVLAWRKPRKGSSRGGRIEEGRRARNGARAEPTQHRISHHKR